jgi:hypothetical protein
VYINDLSLMTPKILVTEQAHSMTKYLCSSQLTSDAGQARRMVTKCLVWSEMNTTNWSLIMLLPRQTRMTTSVQTHLLLLVDLRR